MPAQQEDEQSDFYRTMRRNIRSWLKEKGEHYAYAEYLLAAPDLLHLLCRLAVDTEVAVADKAKLAGAIAYFVSPIDLVPEAIVGPIGYVDDVALAAYVLNAIVNKTGPAVVERHWAGDADVLALIRQILAVADDMVGSGLWKRLKKMGDGARPTGA